MDHEHEWIEEYYGWQCTKCKLFYPYGCAPWEDFGDDMLPVNNETIENLGDEDD